MDDGVSDGELYILRRYLPYEGNVIEDDYMWQAVNSLVRRGLAFIYNSNRLKGYFRLTNEGMAVWNLLHSSDPKSEIVEVSIKGRVVSGVVMTNAGYGYSATPVIKFVL